MARIDGSDWRLTGRTNRRRFLRTAALGAGGLVGAALVGCGGGDEADAPPAATTTSGGAVATATQAAAADAADAGKLTRANFTGPAKWWPEGLPFPLNYPEPDVDPKPGGSLRIAATWDVSVWDPTTTASGGTITVPNIVYNRLLAINAGPGVDPLAPIELKPDLADTWENPDPTTYTFKLAPNIKYHNVAPLNGRAFTAEDVKSAYERYAVEGVHTVYFQAVESMTAVDDQTLTIKLKAPYADFVIPLGSRYLTIFPRELVEQDLIKTQIVGTGPMVFEQATAGDRVTLKKNPDYFRGNVLLDDMVFRIMPDASSRLAAFRAEQIEYAYAPVDTLRDVEALQGSNPDIQVTMIQPSTSVFSLSMNLENPKFQDVRVRRALSMAIDRAAIEKILYVDLAVTLPTIPWVFVYDQQPTEFSPWWKYDLAESKKLLTAAGADGLSFEMLYFEYTVTANTRQNELLVDQLARAGITLKAQSVDYTTFNSQWVGRSIPEAADGWETLGFHPDNYFYQQVHSESPGNRWRINDAELDDWALKQRAEVDPNSRRQIWQQIWDKVLDQSYRIEKPSAIGFDVQQPWVRGLRWGGPLASNSSYYDWGPQLQGVWLNK
ncbi:MAG: ABC transporter substrate-binding protein [Dehalococcoidia bacterium]